MINDITQFSWDLKELARASKAEVIGGGIPETVEAVGTDTRSLPPGCLFVALRGENFDGHTFIDEAVRQGSRAIVIDKEGAAARNDLDSLGVACLVVEDTLQAYGEIAAYHRRELARPVAAITGSNGKTTTKELLAAALGARGSVHKTAGNYNNLIGVPKTLLDWRGYQWASVVEMGMNAPGEIRRLVEIAAPSVGVITNVAAAHLEGLGTIEAVAKAKGELFEGLPENAVGIVNADDPLIESICVPLLQNRNCFRFGESSESDIRIKEYRNTLDGLSIDLLVEGRPLEVELPICGSHNAYNCAAAVAVAYALGSTLSTIGEGLSDVEVPGGRLRLLQDLPAGIHVIDDTYNANPASMKAAFGTLRELAKNARCIAVLGEMYELGDQSDVFHRETGRAAALSGIELVFALGTMGQYIAEGASGGGAQAESFGSIDALYERLGAEVAGGDWVLVKGSRGMKMERVVDFLERYEG